MTRPLTVVSSASPGRTTIRSSSGCRFMWCASCGMAIAWNGLRARSVSTRSRRVLSTVPAASACRVNAAGRITAHGQAQVGVGAGVERRGAVGRSRHQRGRRDHRPVVGAELAGAGTPAGRSPRRPRPPGPAAASSRPRRRRAPACGAPASSAAASELVDELVDDRLLERRGHVGHRRVGRAGARGSPPRSSARRTRSRARRASRAGTRTAAGSPVVREPVDRRTARIAEAEVPRDLVERLARGVVDGLADDAVPPVVLHDHDHRVAARHDAAPRAAARGRGPRATPRSRCASRWFTPTYGRSAASASAFAALTPTSSAPASPGPWHAATASSVAELDARLDQRLGDHRRDELDVGAAGDLGHDATEARVEVDLARHHRRARRCDRPRPPRPRSRRTTSRCPRISVISVAARRHVSPGSMRSMRVEQLRRTRAGRPRAPTSRARPR